jgi:hypothetical protein
MCKILANMTQVSDVASGPFVSFFSLFFFLFHYLQFSDIQNILWLWFMGKRYLYFQTFLREILSVLKYILPLEHYVIPYSPTHMSDREHLSFRENCNIKKKNWSKYDVNSAPLWSTLLHSQLTAPSCCLIKVSQARRGIFICLQIRERKTFCLEGHFYHLIEIDCSSVLKK